VARTDKAFEWLQISFDTHDTGTLALLVDPLLRDLRSASRYKSLLARARLTRNVMSREPSFFGELKRRNVYKIIL
jgi:hypothetical protein